MIRLENVSFAYPTDKRPVFQGLSLEIQESSWVTLTGPEGAGKSTLGKLIHGILKPDEGSISRHCGLEDGCWAVGYLGGDPYDFLVGISVEEEIVFGLENLRLSTSEIKERLDAALVWIGMEGMEKRLTHTLSGGEQQKLALASMLVMESQVLVLDETMGMLDRPTRKSIRKLISDHQTKRHLTIIEITHSLEDALTTDRILFLESGIIRFSGCVGQFLSDYLGKMWFGLSEDQARTAICVAGKPQNQ